jgi:REP element-mobilizing transposase RayT
MPQSLSQVLVHFIFSTKNRFPFLTELSCRNRMHAYVARVFSEQDSPAIEVGGISDHVHVLCALGRNCAMSELIRAAKANSSGWAKTLGGLMRKYQWQGGYGAFSVHPSQVEHVREYIRNQEGHHRIRTFQEEYLNILREYRVPYDERYIWL